MDQYQIQEEGFRPLSPTLSDINDEKDEKIALLEEVLSQKERRIRQLEAVLREQEWRILQKEEVLSLKERRIRQLDELLNEQEERIRQKEEVLREQEMRILQLVDDNRLSGRDISDRDFEIQRLNLENDDLKKKLGRVAGKLKKANAQLDGIRGFMAPGNSTVQNIPGERVIKQETVRIEDSVIVPEGIEEDEQEFQHQPEPNAQEFRQEFQHQREPNAQEFRLAIEQQPEANAQEFRLAIEQQPEANAQEFRLAIEQQPEANAQEFQQEFQHQREPNAQEFRLAIEQQPEANALGIQHQVVIPNENQPSLKCNNKNCSLVFSTREALSLHTQAVHHVTLQKGKEMKKCRVCQREMMKRNLNQHESNCNGLPKTRMSLARTTRNGKSLNG